jgi:hypothetical protein
VGFAMHFTETLRPHPGPLPEGIGIYATSFPGSARERRVSQAPPAVSVFIAEFAGN